MSGIRPLQEHIGQVSTTGSSESEHRFANVDANGPTLRPNGKRKISKEEARPAADIEDLLPSSRVDGSERSGPRRRNVRCGVGSLDPGCCLDVKAENGGHGCPR